MGIIADFKNRRAIHAFMADPEVCAMLKDADMSGRKVVASVDRVLYIRQPGESVFAKASTSATLNDILAQGPAAVLTHWGAEMMAGSQDRWLVSLYQDGTRLQSSSDQDYTSALVHFDTMGNATKLDLAVTLPEAPTEARCIKSVRVGAGYSVPRLCDSDAAAELGRAIL
jgi:hypothetical protein